MNIAVVAAAGKVGRLVVKEAKDRGFNVTAFVRKESNIDGADKVIVKDIFDLTKEDLQGFKAVVDAFGAWTLETFPQHTTVIEHLCSLLSGTQTRLLIVGGAGSLYLDDTHTKRLVDTDGFPEEFKPLALAMADGLAALRIHKDVNWTYISPAADFQEDGKRTGEYILAGEIFSVNPKGESIISYADYAVAMVDEIEHGRHIRERISVLSH